MKIRIGAHPSNLTLTALTHYQPLQQLLLDAGFEPEFLWYPEGKMMHQLAVSGKVNVIGTGTTRAVVAQAEQVQLAYIGASRPRRSWSAILVTENAPIRRAEDLAGKRIGFIEGSFQTYFLLATLEQVGLKYADIVPVNLLPGASLAALQAGEVDAWIAMDPYLSAALAGGGLRKIQDCGDVIANRSVFWVLPEVVAAGEGKVRALFDALVATDAWIGAHLTEAGELFARVIANGLTPEEWTRGLHGREWGISAPDEQLFAEQQAEGDLLFRHGLLAHKIDINATRLPFQLDAVEV
ncbi:sulfonate transport system substrate-binding protein [Paramixta manurensis]|uniref:Sulfonate transport system substrate-binding protein n=1 Tax=Paramixta manurensis TaxID=2740817 RepID=A0A6M8UD73_9GAMM|nr:sulfonate transport system substrate-binding protein [Erwiniaceae bacterium PD-1]